MAHIKSIEQGMGDALVFGFLEKIARFIEGVSPWVAWEIN